MNTAKLSDVKNDLSRYVARVRQGARVRITVRGVAVADLVPVGADPLGAEDWPEMDELENGGMVTRGRRTGSDAILDRAGPRVRGGDAVSAVLKDRSAR